MSIGPFITDAEVQKPNLSADPNGYNKRFNAAIKRLPSTAAIALVDMTNGHPIYAVNSQETAEKHIFSLAKIIPLFVAFRLRERLRSQFRNDSATTAKDLVAKVHKAWHAEVSSKGQLKTGSADFPNLEKIFDLSPPWEFEFLRPDTPWDDLEDLSQKYPDPIVGHLIPEVEIDKLGFWDRLKLSIRMSDNNAAGSVADDIGLSYILATLKKEGFYSTSSHGLWYSTLYGYKKDRKYGGVENTVKDNNTSGGTARTVAAFFTLLVQGNLVDEDSSESMLDILATKHGGYGSWFSPGLPALAVTHSKVGLGGSSTEAAIIQYSAKFRPLPPRGDGPDPTIDQINKFRKTHPTTIKYIMVVLQVSGVRLVDVIKVVDPFVRSEH